MPRGVEARIVDATAGRSQSVRARLRSGSATAHAVLRTRRRFISPRTPDGFFLRAAATATRTDTFVTGRSKEIIIRRPQHRAARPTMRSQHPGVCEAAAGGADRHSRDDRRLVIAMGAGCDEEELLEYANASSLP
jgi:hypothetical protein